MEEVELPDLLYKISRRIWKHYLPVFKEHELSHTEALVISRLVKVKFTRVNDIGTEIGIPPSTMTGIVDRLVLRGWLLRENDPQDRRGVVIRASQQALDLIGSVSQSTNERMNVLLKDFPGERRERLFSDLKWLLGRLEQEEEAT